MCPRMKQRRIDGIMVFDMLGGQNRLTGGDTPDHRQPEVIVQQADTA